MKYTDLLRNSRHLNISLQYLLKEPDSQHAYLAIEKWKAYKNSICELLQDAGLYDKYSQFFE